MTVEPADRLATHFPVLRHFGLPVFIDRNGQPITEDRFLSDASALAERLPEGRHLVNLCIDRYRFCVGFVAALLRRQVTLLPSSEASGLLEDLACDYPNLYFLHDQPLMSKAALMSFPFPKDLIETTYRAIPEIPAGQQAAILFTSGSTGAPMPNARDWGALINSTRDAAQGMGVAGLQGAHLLGTVPHQHSFGLESIIMLSLQHGFTFHGARSLLPGDIVAQLEKMPEPRILVTTPIHLRSLIAHEGTLPRVHKIICATAPLPVELAHRAEDKFGAQLYEIYGCSEVGQIAVRRTVETREWTCIEGIDLSERNGDVWASGKAAATEAPLNDIISLLGPKRFLLQGRKSDMINIAGKRNSLSYLNHHLNAIDGVFDGVFIMPDDTGPATRLIAYVVAPDLSSDQILQKLKTHLDPAFLPRPIYFVDALPRNSLGKLTRQAMEKLI